MSVAEYLKKRASPSGNWERNRPRIVVVDPRVETPALIQASENVARAMLIKIQMQVVHLQCSKFEFELVS